MVPTEMVGMHRLTGPDLWDVLQDAQTAQAYGPSADGASSWPEAWALLARGSGASRGAFRLLFFFVFWFMHDTEASR